MQMFMFQFSNVLAFSGFIPFLIYSHMGHEIYRTDHIALILPLLRASYANNNSVLRAL